MSAHAGWFGEYLGKFGGEKRLSGLGFPKAVDTLIAGVGGGVIIGFLCWLHYEVQFFPCFVVPLGATAVLAFAAPAAPFSQPRNIIGGHVLSALAGVAVYTAVGGSMFWALALANALAIILMLATKTVHPPAGATAVVPILSKISDPLWVLTPVLVGALIIVVFALLYNNVWPRRKYPAFWW